MRCIFILSIILYAIDQNNSEVKRYGYRELLLAMQEKDKTPLHIIDVREIDEVNRTGMIPGSINVPLAEVESALELPSQQFNQKYHANKPKKDETLIFVCKVGVRSFKACRIAMRYNYKNIINFKNGWLEWDKESRRKITAMTETKSNENISQELKTVDRYGSS